MKFKIFIIILFFSCVMLYSETSNENKSAEETRTEKEAVKSGVPRTKPDEKSHNTFEHIRTHYFPFMSIGPGINAFAINLENGGVEILDSLAAIEINLHWWQFGFIHWRTDEKNYEWIGDIYRCSLGSSLGFTTSFSSMGESDDFRWGINISPITFRSQDITIGFSLRYLTSSYVDFGDLSHWSFTIPLTYQFSGGNKK